MICTRCGERLAVEPPVCSVEVDPCCEECQEVIALNRLFRCEDCGFMGTPAEQKSHAALTSCSGLAVSVQSLSEIQEMAIRRWVDRFRGRG